MPKNGNGRKGGACCGRADDLTVSPQPLLSLSLPGSHRFKKKKKKIEVQVSKGNPSESLGY